jgi:RHS repeat-associated protein
MDGLTNVVWRDASNRVLRSFGYAFDSADRIAGVNVENGDRVEYSYDSLDRLTAERRVAADGRVLRDDGYSYDLAGNRLAKTAGAVRLGYSLAQGNRLAGWSVANGPVTAKVDVAGYSTEAIGLDEWWGRLWVETGTRIKPTVSGTNFTARDLPVVPGATQTVVAAIRDGAGNMGYATNRLFVGVATNAVYGCNTAGCVTGMTFGGVGFSRSVSLAWNGQYQLTGLAVDGTNVEAAAYDAMGRRAMIIGNGATNRLVYDGVQVIAEVDAAGSLTRSYVWGPGIDNLLGFTTYSGAATNEYYCLTDHLGTVHAIVDQSGAVVESYQFDAWGRVAGVFDGAGAPLSESALDNRYLWQGREYSWATGLYHFRARWYDPITGRWLSNDPIGISGSLNQFAFVANAPVLSVDPYGLCGTRARTQNQWGPPLRTHSYELAGVSAALIVGVTGDISYVGDTHGNRGIGFTLGGGFGAHLSGRGWGIFTLLEKMLDIASRYDNSSGGINDQAGCGSEVRGATIIGVRADKETGAITGLEAGIGGAAYWTYTWIVPLPKIGWSNSTFPSSNHPLPRGL